MGTLGMRLLWDRSVGTIFGSCGTNDGSVSWERASDGLTLGNPLSLTGGAWGTLTGLPGP